MKTNTEKRIPWDGASPGERVPLWNKRSRKMTTVVVTAAFKRVEGLTTAHCIEFEYGTAKWDGRRDAFVL